MPKIVNHTEYREELLEKCFELFARSGFQSVTMREIGKKLGISKQRRNLSANAFPTQ